MEASTPVWQPILTALSGAITVNDIVSVLGALVIVGVPFVLMWWGARKAVYAFMAAFKAGKFKF